MQSVQTNEVHRLHFPVVLVFWQTEHFDRSALRSTRSALGAMLPSGSRAGTCGGFRACLAGLAANRCFRAAANGGAG